MMCLWMAFKCTNVFLEKKQFWNKCFSNFLYVCVIGMHWIFLDKFIPIKVLWILSKCIRKLGVRGSDLIRYYNRRDLEKTTTWIFCLHKIEYLKCLRFLTCYSMFRWTEIKLEIFRNGFSNKITRLFSMEKWIFCVFFKFDFFDFRKLWFLDFLF